MNSETFLNQVAEKIVQEKLLNKTVIILPNKRAKVFLLNELKNLSDTFIIAPKIISIEDFVSEVSSLEKIDSFESTFEFYKTYLEQNKSTNTEKFEHFYKWAKMLLIDFNDIDTYLLNPANVFKYLIDIDEINRWKVSENDNLSFIEKQKNFWGLLPEYYTNFQNHLISQNKGYSGLLYRKATEKIEKFVSNQPKDITYLFCGFNALNKAEEYIFQYLLENNRAKVLWNIDEYFLLSKDVDTKQKEVIENETGYFARRIKRNWKHYKTHPFEGIQDIYKEPKSIKIIGTPKNIGQTNVASSIINELKKSNPNLDHTAVILGDEHVLPALINRLPNIKNGMNITMGATAKSHPIQLLIEHILKMYVQANNRKNHTFYYKEVLDIITNPIIAHDKTLKKLYHYINKNNLVFFSLTTIDKFLINSSELIKLIFYANTESTDVLQNLIRLIFIVKEQVQSKKDKISLAYAFSIYKALRRIEDFQTKYNFIDTLDNLYNIYSEISQQIEVSFEGEPLEGLQIMGILESRTLDFENVIVTNVNEGFFPGKKAQQTFIPYDVKLELGLPTFKEKDAIFAYHFFHILHRAKNVYLLYNNDENSSGNIEVSRYIKQLKINHPKQHTIEEFFYNNNQFTDKIQLKEINKSVELNKYLKILATEKGFSPSSLSSYLRNPFQFYMQSVLGIRDQEEVEENIALNTLGTIIHNTLEDLFTPYISSKKITVKNIDVMKTQVTQVLTSRFHQDYSKSIIGKNLLAYEVAKENIQRFLDNEKKLLQQNTLEIVSLEEDMTATIEHERLPYPIKIRGKVDRIERRNGMLNIIDYKTGKVESKDLTLSKSWKDIEYANKEKAMQLFCYALMAIEKYPNEQIQLMIYSFKNPVNDFISLKYLNNTIIDESMITDFKEVLVDLILEILNPETSFKEKIVESFY